MNKILLIPKKTDQERDSVAQAWENQGGIVQRIAKFWIKPNIPEDSQISIYGNDTFALVLAQVLGLKLLIPQDEIIAELDYPWTKRHIQIKPINTLKEINFPKFIKPAKPKLFPAKVYKSLPEIKQNITDMPDNEQIIISEIIHIDKEVRAFILNNQVQDLAFYEGEGDIQEPKIFIENFLKESNTKLPLTYVLDLGFNQQSGWFIIEFNASWGAGLNFCNPEKVLDCIFAATINL